jgi:hypothetical protein
MRLHLEKNPSQKRAGGVTQGVGPEFKPQYCKKKTKKNKKKQNPPTNPESGTVVLNCNPSSMGD